MDRTRWQLLSALLDEALALPASERADWLARQRAADAERAGQLERMLAQASEDVEADPSGHAERTTPVAGLPFERWLGQALAQGGGAGPAGPDTVTLAAGRDTVTLALQRCGSWQLLYKIGEGGMGQVWLARRADGLYEAQAAIKLLRGDVRATRLAARFARERALLARLNHPAIARLLDAGTDNGRAFLVLEHVDGRALADHVRERCPTVADRVRLMIRIAEGVEHAHAQLIVHRDLKPSNVLVTAAGDPKLLDFGIAGVLDAEGQAGDEQLTRQIGRMLTPAYAAPEQVKGEPIGIAADIFSLSVMLYELLSGELPFAPRDTDRAALEHALLHKEPRRLTQTRPGRSLPWRTTRAARSTTAHHSTGTGGTGAGVAARPARAAPPDPATGSLAPVPPPLDFHKVRGDLEAVVAKGLRKLPDERYGSVRALILDLERWLSHRPVSVRHDDWRHRVGLWLRRNALLAGTAAVVLTVMLAGLAASTWQWRRAEQAARQSEQVTRYLSDLLASASPDRHGGELPSLLALLDTSRQEVSAKFANEPETLLRLQEVLGSTYHALNRFDVAIPLGEQRLALALRTHGPDDEHTVAAAIDLARIYTATGTPDRVVAQLEPRLPRLRAEAAEWNRLSSALYMLAVAQAHLGRFELAQGHLDEAWQLVQQHFAADDFRRVFFANYVAVLRSAQGRLAEAEAALAATRPAWATAPRQYARFVLVLRRNLLNAEGRLGRFEGYEAQARTLLADMDQLFGRGNDMSLLLGQELGRHFLDMGQPERALRELRDVERRLEAAGVNHGLVRLPVEASRLWAQAAANEGAPAVVLGRARQVLEAIDREPDLRGLRRAEAWLALARVALLHGDPWLAAAALERVRADGGLGLQHQPPLRGRVEQLEGQLLRLQGNLAASRDRLQARLQALAGWTDRQVMPVWTAQLDLAITLVAMQDAGAAAALAEADRLRPLQLPADHPLDQVRRHLQARLEAPGAETEATRNTWAAVERGHRRAPGQLPRSLVGLMP